MKGYRTFSLIMRLYPARWRTRYGEELRALLEDQLAAGKTHSWRIALGCLWGALRERIYPTVGRAAALVPAMAGPSSLELPPNRSTKKVVAIVVSILTVSLILFAIAWWSWVIKPSLKYFPFGPGFRQNLAALNASMAAPPVAAATAQSLGVPLGQISQQELQNADTGLQWLPGTVSSFPAGASTAGWNVSVTASDEHVITALRGVGGCDFGLDVASASDPIIVTDYLPGPGLYFASSTGSGQPARNCAAVDAPTADWTRYYSGGDVMNGKYVGPGPMATTDRS